MHRALKVILAVALALYATGRTALLAQPEHWPDSSSLYIRATDAIARQTGAGRSFSPASNYYLPAAVNRFGIIGGILSTFDRINRSGRIGMAAQNDSFRAPSDHRLHEGLDAYCFKSSTEAVQPPIHIEITPVAPGRSNAGSDWSFINYLLESGMKRDAAAVLFQDGIYAPSDTLSYLRGLTAYYLKDFGTASYYLGSVGQTSPLFDQAFFHSTASLMELGCNAQSIALLKGYNGARNDLKRLQLEAASLLEDDLSSYLDYSGSASEATSYSVMQAEQSLARIYSDRTSAKEKKPWIAATASALVPGLGKVYAGNLSEGIASFLVVGSFGAVTAECISKKGFGDWRSITFGALGALFYLGNIYGSYFSVERINTYTHEAQNQAIMYNIHVPLRSVLR